MEQLIVFAEEEGREEGGDRGYLYMYAKGKQLLGFHNGDSYGARVIYLMGY